MGITYFEGIVLYNLKKIQGDRTIYSLFHLFQGKRSSQTIQDAHLYHLTAFFHTIPSLKRSQLENTIQALLTKGMVEEIGETKVILTNIGHRELELQLEKMPLPPCLNGWKYYQVTELFWERLTLLIQVCSNLINRERNFIPIRNKKEVLSWVKQYISQQGEDRYQLAEKLLVELTDALDNPHTHPDYIVIRLTGFKKIGLTSVQAAERAGLEHANYHFEFLNALHALFEKIEKNPSSYPLLKGLIKDQDQKVPLTLSTNKTLSLLKKGYSLEEIAAARNLKLNTIEDHVVEIALSVDGFDIDHYVSQEEQQKIIRAAKTVSAKKLKQIKEQVSGVTYFKIRLVMAKYGDVEWN